MQAIMTKYFGPGDVRGSRIKATAAAGSVTIEYDDALSLQQNHAMAMKALCKKVDWEADFVSGVIKSGETVWVSY